MNNNYNYNKISNKKKILIKYNFKIIIITFNNNYN